MIMYSWNGVSYNPETGEMKWLIDKGAAKAGDVVTNVGSHGYKQVGINGNTYLQHRLIWKIVYGYWPQQQIDHKNGDKLDNRIENLREVSRDTNSRNQDMRKSRSNTGIRGVHYRKEYGTYLAMIGNSSKHGKHSRPGCKKKAVKTLEEAVRLRKQWERELEYGREFANG